MKQAFFVAGFAWLAIAPAQADTITAQAGSGGLNNAGPVTGHFTNIPKPGDGVTWRSGKNIADNLSFPAADQSFDPYFLFDPTEGPFGYFFNGYGKNDDGDLGSVAHTEGNGRSRITKTNETIGGRTVTKTNYNAEFTASATGTLSTEKGAKYFALSTAKDPWAFNLSDFDVLAPGPDFRLYFRAGISSGSFTPTGGLSFGVSYETAQSTLNLLSIAFGGDGVTVTGDPVPGLSIYLLNTLDDDSGELTNAISLAAILSLMQAEITNDNSIDRPYLFGFVIDDLLRPTTPLPDGSVARLHVDISATEQAGVPEPAEWILVGSGLALLAALRHRRRG